MAVATSTATLIAAGIAGGGGLYGAHRQSSAARRAAEAQERARQEALAYERQQQAAAQQRQRRAWDAYQTAYQAWYSRYGDQGIDRYGVPVGVNYRPAPAAGAAGAAAAGAATPGAATPRGPVTLAGGRQVAADEYDRYVQQREARRGRTIGQLANPMPPGVQT